MPYDYFAGLQRSVGEWANQTFARATDASIVAHLRREVAELDTLARWRTERPDIAWNDDNYAEEMADCLLLLLHLAHRNGVNLEEAARRKYAVNRQRHWGEPDAEGVVEHVR